MIKEKILEIDPRDEETRRFLFDLPFIGDVKQATAGTHLWSDTYHLLDGTWDLPCVRCEYLHKSMWSWWTSGEKCVACVGPGTAWCGDKREMLLLRGSSPL